MKNFKESQQLLLDFIQWCIDREVSPWEGDYEERIVNFLHEHLAGQ
jgi:hypothetical protein